MKSSDHARRVTLQDIARRTGYSVTAVSRALRHKSDIGPEATAQIQQAAQEMGYVTNQTAVSLRYGRTNVITVLLVNLTNPYFSIMSNQLQIAAQEMGYSLVIVCSQDDPDLELELAEQAIARHSDGVMLFPTVHSGPAIDRLRAAGIPLVLLSSEMEPYQLDCVLPDDEAGAHLATLHLAQEGCRRLAFISSSNSAPSYLVRREGFLRACKELGLDESSHRICDIPDLHRFTTQYLAQPNPLTDQLIRLNEDGFDGLFVFCDAEAWRVMNAILLCPTLSQASFGIVGFDNVDGNLVTPTPLCSVDCDLGGLARQGIALLHQRIEGDQSPPLVIRMPVHIICRNSCCRGRRN